MKRAERHERERYALQHQLGAQKHHDQVSAGEKPDDSHREEQGSHDQ